MLLVVMMERTVSQVRGIKYATVLFQYVEFLYARFVKNIALKKPHVGTESIM